MIVKFHKTDLLQHFRLPHHLRPQSDAKTANAFNCLFNVSLFKRLDVYVALQAFLGNDSLDLQRLWRENSNSVLTEDSLPHLFMEQRIIFFLNMSMQLT